MSTLLFGVISGPTIQSAESALQQLKPYVDGIELRLDCFETIDLIDLKTFLRSCELPVMFTVRSMAQGGSFLGTEGERLALLESLCALGPAYVDLEHAICPHFRKRLFELYPKIAILCSYHNFLETPEDLEALYHQMKTPYAHLYKIAVMAQSSLDALKVLRFVQSHSEKEKIVGISMGEEGKFSRFLAPVVGCFLTYVQVADAKEFQEIYRFAKLNRQTAIYALIGDPVDRSLGHILHNALFDREKVNAVYVKIGIKKGDLLPFFVKAGQLPFRGFSMTMPHKEGILPFLTHISSDTQAIGACNTIAISNGTMGHNTDGIGALNAIEQKGAVCGKHVVLIGAGGAARALAFEAARRGAFVTIINRTPAKALEIAAAIGGDGGGWDLLQKVCEKGYDIIVNCIPDGDLIEEQWILPGKVAMDIVYVPKNTPFLEKASRKKCHIVFGEEMFMGQALEQQSIWKTDLLQDLFC